MSRLDKSERIGAMIKILTEQPNRMYTLNYFSELFGVAKSTISEDIMLMRHTLEKFDLGSLETVVGAAGGVKYIFQPGKKQILDFIQELCEKLSEPQRILPGGFLYMTDILFMPSTASKTSSNR
jgi:purine operon repressor